MKNIKNQVSSMQEFTTIDVVYDLFIDDAHISFVEDDSLPIVVNPRLPFDLHIYYDSEQKKFICEAKYQCAENKEEFVFIRREYTTETVAEVVNLYEIGEA